MRDPVITCCLKAVLMSYCRILIVFFSVLPFMCDSVIVLMGWPFVLLLSVVESSAKCLLVPLNCTFIYCLSFCISCYLFAVSVGLINKTNWYFDHCTYHNNFYKDA